MENLHKKINFRGNREQHRTIGGYQGWRFADTKHRRRKGVIVVNENLRNKTGRTINYFEFY